MTGIGREQSRHYPEAIIELQKAISLGMANSTLLGALGHVYAVSGQTREAAKILQQLQKLPPRLSPVNAFDIALIHTGLGHNDQAFLWLGKACDERDYWIGTLAVEPRLAPLPSHPPVAELVRKVDLPPPEVVR